MRNPDLLKVAERLDAAVARGDERLATQRTSGERNAITAAVYAQAEHAARVIVDYTRHRGQELEDTGLLVVPPPPRGLQLDLPEGMEWPTGMTCGALRDADARKVAARAIAAHLQEERDRALNDFRCDRTATELAQGQVSAFQSVLKAESQEAQVSTFHGQPPPEAMFEPPIGSGQGPRQTPPPPPRRR